MDTHTWRLFTEEKIASGQSQTLNDDEHHLAFHVLRLKTGEHVELADGAGSVGAGTVEGCDKKQCVIRVDDVRFVPQSDFQMHLFLGMPKPSTLDEIIATATELGVSHFAIFSPDKASSKASPKPEKLVKQIRSALRICKLPWAPAVELFSSLSKAVENNSQFDAVLFCDESPIHTQHSNSHQHILKTLTQRFPKARKIAVFIGPEASFSSAEKETIALLANSSAVSLGDSILTVPTATSVALTNVLAFEALLKQ